MKKIILILSVFSSAMASASINDCSISFNGSMNLSYVRLQQGQYVVPSKNCRLSCGEVPPIAGVTTMQVPNNSCSVSGPAGAYYQRASEMRAVECPHSNGPNFYYVACLN